MYFRKTSIAVVVVIVIVTSTTLLLGGYGLVRFRADREREWAALRQETEVNADQLAIALSLPAWNLDAEQIAKNIESAMQDRDIYGITVRVADKSYARVRNSRGSIVARDGEITEPGLIETRRPIAHLRDAVGSVAVFATPDFVEAKLSQARNGMIWVVLLLDLALVLSLYFLIWRIVLKPLRQLELYAMAVSSGAMPQSNLDQCRFRGELENLRASLDKMIHLLQDRYNALQASETRFRTLVEMAPVAINISRNGQTVYVNQRFLELYRFEKAEELAGKPITNHWAPEFREAIADRAQRRARGEAVSGGFEGMGLRKDGSFFHVNVEVGTVELPDGPASLGLLTDTTESKRAEALLRESEERYRTVVEFTPECVAVGVDERIAYINAAGAKMFGCPNPEAMMGRFVYEFVPAELHEITRERRRKVVEEGIAAPPAEFSLRREDGSVVCVEAQAAPFIFHGRPAVLNLIRDITLRKQAEEGLRRSESHYRALFQGAPDAIFTLSGESWSDCNPHALQLFGCRREELIGQTPMTFSPPRQPDGADSAYKVREKIQAALLGQPQFFEWRHCRRDGVEFDAEVSLTRIELDEHPLLLAVVRDITDRKRRDQLLRESEEKFSKAFRASPTGIGITELETGRYIEVNEGFCQIYGYTQEQMIGHTSLELGVFETASDRDRVLAPVRDRDGSVHDYQMRIRTRAGEAKTVLVNLERIDLRGKECLVVVLYDITARLRAEERLQSSRAQLRALTSRIQSLREEERTHLAREIHDHLGQLLTALNLDLRLVERRAAHVADVELRGSLQAKIASARQLADETITSVQKIASELRPAILDRLGLDAAIEVETRAFEDRTGVLCEVSLPATPVVVTPDQATAIYRVFQEVLTNVARHARATRVCVKLTQESDELVLTVTDDGIGIGNTDLESPKSLGLLGMRERAQILGGSISLSRNGEKGTAVTVSIPRHVLEESL